MAGGASGPPALGQGGGPALKVGQIEVLAVGPAEGGPKKRIQRAVLIDRKVLSRAGLPILRSELEGDRHHCTHIRIGHFLIFLPGALVDFLEIGQHGVSTLHPHFDRCAR